MERIVNHYGFSKELNTKWTTTNYKAKTLHRSYSQFLVVARRCLARGPAAISANRLRKVRSI